MTMAAIVGTEPDGKDPTRRSSTRPPGLRARAVFLLARPIILMLPWTTLIGGCAAGTALLVLISLAAIAGLGYWLWGMASLSLAIGVGLVIGGALGNLIDRLVYGRVADFFHLYGFGYDFYVFNVADVAITFGAVAIIYEVLKPAEA